MSNISLRVCVFDNKLIKTIVFNSNSTVNEVCSLIRRKIPEAQVGDEKDYGIFRPDNERDLNEGTWIDCNRDLSFYGLKNGDVILYRKKYRNLKVRMLDGSVKTCVVDDSQPVTNLMVVVCFKIGITNSDEYGLIRQTDGYKDLENYYINNYNTLTLRRRNRDDKERDAKMDTLRKKIKTDDEVDWVDGSRTLREQGILEDEEVLLKRKFFFSDQNVDSHDPVQLNLLYVQARDDIVNGTHPVTQNVAAVLAGYQCHIKYGDFDQRKTKAPYFHHDLKEFLPEAYAKVRGVEKNVLDEYAKHKGKSVVDVKLLYVKTARSLPTYGVTFFLVKEKMKGKNKLAPRLLGVNKESILRLDEKTKEVLQTWPLTTVRRWGASSNTFALDFGDYADEYYSVQTCEAEQIANLVAGYIDIIMKRRQSKEHFGIDGEENSAMVVEDNVLPLKAIVLHQRPDTVCEATPTRPVVASVYTEPQQALLSTVTIGQQIITTVEQELYQTVEIPSGIDPSVLKWREERNVTSHLAAMNAATAQVVTLTSTTKQVDFTAVGDAITTITTGLPEVSKGVRTLAALTDDESSGKLLDATRKLCHAFSDLLTAAEPESKQPRQNLLNAASRIGDATNTLMSEIGEENASLKEAQDLLLNMGKDVAKKTAALVLRGKSVASTLDDQDERTRAIEEATKCALSTSQLVACAKVVAPTIESTLCREQLVMAVREVSSTVESLVEFCNESCKDQQLLNQLSDAARDVTTTLNSLLHHINQFSNGYHTEVVVYNQQPTVHQDTEIERVQVTAERVVQASDDSERYSGNRYIVQSEYSETLQTRLIAAAKNLAEATAYMAYTARA